MMSCTSQCVLVIPECSDKCRTYKCKYGCERGDRGQCVYMSGGPVSCGGHTAAKCALCGGYGWCNGECVWRSGRCRPRDVDRNEKWHEAPCEDKKAVVCKKALRNRRRLSR